VDPVPDPLLFFLFSFPGKSGSAGIEPGPPDRSTYTWQSITCCKAPQSTVVFNLLSHHLLLESVLPEFYTFQICSNYLNIKDFSLAPAANPGLGYLKRL
jgi:hypothetical protein